MAVVGEEVVGIAVWFRTFSTRTGRAGIYLEDLYVDPAHRGQGHARDLLVTLARRCAAEGLPRFEWVVSAGNDPAIEFYRRMGAVAHPDLIRQRLDGNPLAAVADLALLND